MGFCCWIYIEIWKEFWKMSLDVLPAPLFPVDLGDWWNMEVGLSFEPTQGTHAHTRAKTNTQEYIHHWRSNGAWNSAQHASSCNKGEEGAKKGKERWVAWGPPPPLHFQNGFISAKRVSLCITTPATEEGEGEGSQGRSTRRGRMERMEGEVSLPRDRTTCVVSLFAGRLCGRTKRRWEGGWRTEGWPASGEWEAWKVELACVPGVCHILYQQPWVAHNSPERPPPPPSSVQTVSDTGVFCSSLPL